MTPEIQKELDELVRDFTQIPPPPKSEVRRRIEEYANSRIEKMMKEVEYGVRYSKEI